MISVKQEEYANLKMNIQCKKSIKLRKDKF